MVKAQEWLDREYPKEKRSKVSEIYLNETSLEGELDLGDFTYSKWPYLKVYISPQLDETKITFKNLPEKAEIIEKAIASYDDLIHLTKEKKARTEVIDISWKNLEGHLNLSDFVNLESLNCYGNNLTFLNLSNCPKLEKIDCYSNQLINITLPTNLTNLKELYLRHNNLPNQNLINQYGSCPKCLQPNTSNNWCQPCAEKEWEKLEGQELIERFIQQQGKNKLLWIPYERFTNIEPIGEGGFSKIYKAYWKKKTIESWQNEKDKWIVLKALNNSQNITLDFLTEITNTNLVNHGVVECYGISQDPQTKNYVMVMQYMKKGNLRQVLQQKNKGLSLENKLEKLRGIIDGLNEIHEQNLVHKDFHSGNILNSIFISRRKKYFLSYISDLGLSRLVNYQKGKGKIFGVLPYIAPEVLRGQTYIKKADVYSFGIIAYELLANAYPYPEMDDLELSLKVCQGCRPNIEELKIPQLLKDLIKKCWDDEPNKRPSAKELKEIIYSWETEIKYEWKQKTQFYQQYQALKDEYNTFSQRPYQIHSNATLTSKMIDTKEITEKLKTMEYGSISIEPIDFTKLNLENKKENNNHDWTSIHADFNNETLIQNWQTNNFTYSQTQDWINIGLQPTDHNFCAWIRDTKHFTPEQILNHSSLEQLNQEFFTWWQEQQTNIEVSPK